MEGEHLTVMCTLSASTTEISTYSLIDCGATGLAFLDETFARHHNLPLTRLQTPRNLEVIDGRPITSGPITHIAEFYLKVGQHVEKIFAFVTTLGHYPLVLGIPWLRLHDVAINWASNSLTFDSDYCLKRCSPDVVTIQESSIPVPEVPSGTPTPLPTTVSTCAPPPVPLVPIAGISAISLNTLLHSKRKPVESVTAITLYEINQALENATKPPADTTPRDDTNKPAVDAATIVPSEYHEFLPTFSKKLAETLPAHRPYDHKINLEKGFTPPFGPVYSCSVKELETLKEWLEDNLRKGFIRASSSPAGSPVIFVKEKDGTLRVCVDYRGLNAGTIKNRYPLQLIQETLRRLQKAKYFTKLDIWGPYNLLRMAAGDEWMTAFRTRYGLFESLVMPFGITNGPADWQHFINDVLRPFLDIFCTAYLDDILIYSDTLEEHQHHVKQVLQALTDAGLAIKPEKCEFHKTSVEYLGLIITTNGTEMDPKKVATVSEWPTPENVKDVQGFLGFPNFYRRFINGYSKIVSPMTALTRKDTPFVWSPTCQEAFDALKAAFTSTPILRHFDYERDIVVKTDASNFVCAGVLSQYDDDGVLHPVAYYSKKHSPAECNYEIYDKELMAIVRAFKEWRPHLEGTKNPIQVLSDHKNLE